MRLLIVIIFFALLTPLFLKESQNPSQKNLSPSFNHPFGTDDLGRDLFSRSALALRLSVSIAALAALIDLLVGAILGSLATLKGGRVETTFFYTIDLISCFPYLLICMTFTVALGGGLFALIASLTAFGWMNQARVVRGVLTQTLKQDYIVASKLLGTKPYKLFYRHLLPHLKKPVLAALTLQIPSCIFSEAFLSFLGLGVKPPMASLGTMIKEGLSALEYYPWRLGFPALLLTLTLFAFNIIVTPLEEKRA